MLTPRCLHWDINLICRCGHNNLNHFVAQRVVIDTIFYAHVCLSLLAAFTYYQITDYSLLGTERQLSITNFHMLFKVITDTIFYGYLCLSLLAAFKFHKIIDPSPKECKRSLDKDLRGSKKIIKILQDLRGSERVWEDLRGPQWISEEFRGSKTSQKISEHL